MGKITKKKYTSNKNGDSIRDLDYLMAEKYVSRADVPFMEGLATVLDCDEDTITNRAKDDPKFGAIVKSLKRKQRLNLMGRLLTPSNMYSPRGVMFLLNVNHGMIETQRSEIANPDGKTFSVTSDNFNKLDDKQLTDLLRGASQESNQG